MSGPEDFSDLLELTDTPEERALLQSMIDGVAELKAMFGCKCPRGWPKTRSRAERRPGVSSVVHHDDCPLRT